jgi:threonine dehydrogenase-like Zn-dependent dehydrogenase
MKAAYIQNGEVLVGDMPDPVPSRGQALVRTHSCGMCASEQHFLHSGRNVIDLSRQYGGPYARLDFARPFVPGHEYVGEVIDYGPGSKRTVPTGRRVTSVPVMRHAGGHSVIGFSHECPGGWGELMLLDENVLMEIPSDLDDDMAAMTEPLAVGLEHARRGRPTRDDAVLVIGCGAIGLGVIAGLKLMGIAPIIAADFHRARRDAAIGMGVMGGYCMEAEQFYVFAAQNKRLTVHFAAGEEQQDMELALRSIADGSIDVRPWLRERIGLGAVAEAVARMSGPLAPIRNVIDPRRM